MNADILYEIYTITRDNQANDLTIGLAMYRAQHPGLLTHEEDKAIRAFMGRHGRELSDAFPDRTAFDAAVEACENADDLEAEEAREKDKE